MQWSDLQYYFLISCRSVLRYLPTIGWCLLFILFEYALFKLTKRVIDTKWKTNISKHLDALSKQEIEKRDCRIADLEKENKRLKYRVDKLSVAVRSGLIMSHKTSEILNGLVEHHDVREKKKPFVVEQ